MLAPSPFLFVAGATAIFLFGITSASVGCHQSPLSSSASQVLRSLLLLLCMLPLLRQEKFFVFPTFSFFAILLTFSLKIVRKVNYVARFFKLNVTKFMFASIEF